MSADNCSNRLSTVSCKVVSEYFHSKLVMEEKSTQQINEKQSTSKGKQAKPNTAIKKPRKKVKGQKDIRSLIKTKNELLKYSKDFDFVCKQAGIDVDPEQLQLAIALSKSLQESEPAAKDETDNKKSLTSNQRRGQIKITLKEYGFKVPVTQKDSKKRIKRYRKQYKLLLVSETEKQRLIADKYSQLIFRYVSNCKISEENLSKYQNSDSHLYNLSTNIPYACMKDDDIFYVNDLVSKSLNHKHDMLRDWSQIPGRPVSPQLVRNDICFKSTQFAHEELNSILSGTIEKAQYIVSQNHIMNNRDSERTNSDNAYSNPVLIDIEPTVSGLKIISQNNLNIEQNTPSVVEMDSNKTHEDYVCGGVIDVESYRYDIQTTNRSGSPDLFDDDDATILLDTSTEKVSSHEDETRRTMVRENDFMDLTKCVDAMNYNNTKLKQNSCLSQRTNKTRTDPNDFMDLTHCVTATSQKILNDIYCTDKNAKCMDNDNVKDTIALTVDLNSSPNSNSELLATSNSNCKEKSMDDTIIMLDENYYRTECNPANLASKETGIIDLDEDHCCEDISEEILTNILNHSKYNLEKSQCIDNPNNASPRPFQGEYKCLDMGGMVPAEPSDADNLSFVHIQSVQSIVMYENCDREYEVNNMSHEHLKSKINGIENHVELDLTQSSNSADSLQFVQEVCTNNESQDETLILKNDGYKSNNMQNEENLKYMSENNHNCVGEKPENQCEINLDCSGEHKLQENVSLSSQPTLISNDRNEALNIDGAVNYDNDFFENDPDTQNHEFDFIQKSKEELHEAKEDHSLSNENNYFFTTEQDQYKVDFVDDREIDYVLENVSSKQNNVDTFKSYDSNFSGVNLTNEENKSGCENESHVQNDSDIDLTQQSDSSEGKNSSQNVIEIPTDLGKINDVSIDYDDLCIEVEELATRNCNVLDESKISRVMDEDCSEEKAAIIDDISIKVHEQIATKSPFKNYIYKDKSCSQVETGNIVYDDSCIAVKEQTTRISNKTIQNPHKRDSSLEKDKSLCKDEAITSSSQHSEVFEISDDEIDYSMNQHIQESDSIQVEHGKFDIGGMSIINEFLNRKSVSRKQLRCSCSSNTGLSSNDDKDENCLPVVTLRSDDNETRKSKSFGENNAVKISIPLRSRSDDNILSAQTPKHNDYIVKTDNVTPMPNYELMSSPERNEQLDKFGIKPLKRRRAIQILTHIYNQTHPVMEVISETEPWSSPSKIRRKDDEMSFPRRVIASQIDDIVWKTSIESHVSTIEPCTSTYVLPESSNTCKGSKRPECPRNANKESQLYDETKSLPDLKDIQCSPEDWVFQKREKAKVHSCRVPLHIAFHNYVSCRQSLREAILRYEPIRIDSIHKGLVASGYKYNPKDLLKFMDKKCITVKTADNSRKNENKNK